VGLAQVVFLGLFKIFLDHFCYEFLEGYFGSPAEFCLGFGRVAQQGFHFRGPEVFGVHGHNGVTGFGVNAFFVYAFALPGDVNAQFIGGDGDKLPHRLHNGG